MNLMGYSYCRQLRVGEEDLIHLRSAALLHDIGHGPFSHVFEAPLKEINGPEATHEEITRRLIREDEGIVSVLGERTDEVIALLSEDQNGILHQIISGNIDADKMDYLRRDSYHAGVTYGNFDLERVLYTLRKTGSRQREDLTIHEKGIDAVESFRLARFLMHAQVYYHHTNVVANGMLQRAISVAIRDKVVDAERIRMNDSSFLQHYLALDDARLLSQVLQNRRALQPTLSGGWRGGTSFKRGDESYVSQEEDPRLRYHLTYTGKPRTTFYLFCPEEYRQRVQECAGDVTPRRSGEGQRYFLGQKQVSTLLSFSSAA